ncbi:phosphoribosyltransferase [Pantoea rwandensis]|uniref:Phosphoribosyltransferase domain-containing protein n=1 Tax=Pantoea rwandensis TaxID=1076550 RepID=A0ABM5RGZ4_9GAMM|nr:phosphoribosyltransferase [Pantoea rwandensis]AIR85250.1 hypothetical protein LH22_07125 [Pantoea rwandensis]
MGIDVVKGVVTFNPAHEGAVSTSIVSNPKFKKIYMKGYGDGVFVYSIFARMRTKHKGDGNPLIYALKKMKGFTISFKEIIKFKANSKKILAKISSHKNFACDIILVMPSSSNVAGIFARFVGFVLKKEVVYDYFEKCTIDEVLMSFNFNVVTKKDEEDVTGVLYTLHKMDGTKIFDLKEINTSIRHYFQPLKINKKSVGRYVFDDKDILFIDDVLSSGTTLLNAHKLISSLPKKIIAITFLSDLYNY